ncbi:hypothetical protein ACFORG_22210 [Lutimaribacter marinistellae]|uniref:Short chain dehydrogenase n=1 Tax=Lutimaribacter marinistellae TaxID=1820329 RepID=A0ABV7TLF1_9RHOB
MQYLANTGTSLGIGKALAWKSTAKGRNLIMAAWHLVELNEIRDSVMERQDVDVIVDMNDLSAPGKPAKRYGTMATRDLSVLTNNPASTINLIVRA